LRSIKGKGAFQRFRAAISELGIQQKWYDFRASELEEIAADWLDSEEIPYTREDIAEPNAEISM
jgi:hypothetical protein